MYKDGVIVSGSVKNVTNTPELVHYTKECKILNSLRDARVKFEQSILLPQCKKFIQAFFERYASLSADTIKAQHNLLSLA